MHFENKDLKFNRKENMSQVKWFDRKFDFTHTENIFPSIIERLSGTPLRLESKLRSIDKLILENRVGNTWSIKENAGHLTDLEPLWRGRLEDIITGAAEMRLTDLSNAQTTLANHNAKSIDTLIEHFYNTRNQTVAILNTLDETTIFKSALHPRLKTPMRTVDLFLFVAEHDDHHLARITELSGWLANTQFGR